MNKLRYDLELEKLAIETAATCDTSWSNVANWQQADSSGLVEVWKDQLYTWQQKEGVVQFVNDSLREFADSKAHYNYESHSCARGRYCEHYKQMVTAGSEAVGCSVQNCGYLLVNSRDWHHHSDPNYTYHLLVCYFGGKKHDRSGGRPYAPCGGSGHDCARFVNERPIPKFERVGKNRRIEITGELKRFLVDEHNDFRAKVSSVVACRLLLFVV